MNIYLKDVLRQFGKNLITLLDENPSKLDLLKLYIDEKPIVDCKSYNYLTY